ncbi:hypothetical protein MLD38_034989 [Melastoma candidum]|uniref:Uncharacterized protein n=1 Tax=Melastoma candidum TaxID=119954 RepID=A0ACB9MBN6_9MYRT|nr:hypothetical protein MLD38_034989 [Melastoma candidum]
MEMGILKPAQKYAAAGLFAFSLHQSQIHQSRLRHTLPSLEEEGIGDGSSGVRGVSVSSDHPEYWIHESSGLLWPIFRFLGVDEQCWQGLQETAGSSSQIRHHIGAFLELLVEEKDDSSPETKDKELALSKAVDAVVLNEDNIGPKDEEKSSRSYEEQCHEKLSNDGRNLSAEDPEEPNRTLQLDSRSAGDEKLHGRSGIRKHEEDIEESSRVSRPMKLTVLYELLSACMADKSKDGERPAVMDCYDARHRVALRLLAEWMGVKWTEMEALETIVALSSPPKEKGRTEEESGESESSWMNWKRGGVIGAAALGGGAVMAITGGLAAPAIAHGLGALAPTLGSIVPSVGASGFAAAATATGTGAGAVAVAASFGAAGAGLTGYKMARRTGDIEEFEFERVGEKHDKERLAVEILVSGLAFGDDDFVRPWEGIGVDTERYALKWESRHLIALSTAVRDWFTSKIAAELMKEGAMFTVLSALVTALALPATLVTASDLIDSQWAVTIDRSDKAGKLLCDVLLQRLQGNRPVTLIGFSLGARVIFKCLQCLAEACNADKSLPGARIVERVVLLGAPIPIKDENWETVRKMVAGRFVNVYSPNDWTLGIAFRASLLLKGLAGIQEVDIPGVENVDVSGMLEGHASYLWKTKAILQKLQMDTP